MMEIFGNSAKIRGCFARFDSSPQFLGARLVLPVGTRPASLSSAAASIPEPGIDDYLITNISFAEKEKIHVVQCFQNSNYVYAFGHDPLNSMIKVSFVGSLIQRGGGGLSEIMNDFMLAYEQNRISKTQEMAAVTLGAQVLLGFIIGLESSGIDPQFNLQSFDLTLLAVTPQGSRRYD